MTRTVKFLLLLAAFSGRGFAIPTLQLDVSPGVYDSTTESTATTSSQFSLYALLNSLTPGGTYYIAAGLTPANATPNDLGSFVFNGQTIAATADMQWGSPALLPSHNVYPTWYKEFAFTFNPAMTTTNYDVEDVVGIHNGPVLTSPGNALYRAFDVDVSGLAAGTTLVFDLYTYIETTTIVGKGKNARVKYDKSITFAPFSHNAEGTAITVPESGWTVALLGIALVFGEILRRVLVRRA